MFIPLMSLLWIWRMRLDRLVLHPAGYCQMWRTHAALSPLGSLSPSRLGMICWLLNWYAHNINYTGISITSKCDACSLTCMHSKSATYEITAALYCYVFYLNRFWVTKNNDVLLLMAVTNERLPSARIRIHFCLWMCRLHQVIESRDDLKNRHDQRWCHFWRKCWFLKLLHCTEYRLFLLRFI